MFIVEDDLTLQKIYLEILTTFGYEVIDTAINGEEAVEKFKSFLEKPEIIIMDYRMPLKNGIDATKEILKLDSDSRIIFASADSSIETLALSIGAISFLEKPFDIDNLIDLIQKIPQML
ncbi:MAG: response regulator [Promethearchaeota archaeon]